MHFVFVDILPYLLFIVHIRPTRDCGDINANMVFCNLPNLTKVEGEYFGKIKDKK